MRGRHAGAVLEVLHAERHPGQRAWVFAARHLLVDCFRRLPGQVGVDVHEGVQLVVLGVDGGQALVEHRRGLQLPPPDGFSDLHNRAHGGSH